VLVVSAAPQSTVKPARARPELVPDVVFDVGMHRGEDTVYYLRKGFCVVAFEAHPDLVDAARRQFATEIADGRLQIVSGAITAQGADSVTFYIHSRMSIWGTTDPHRADHNEVMGPSAAVTVPAVDFAACLREYGVPHYLKIDIEGADMLCLEALFDVEPAQRPRYASIEAEAETWSGVVRQFDVLERLGYSRFAIVQQGNIGGRVGQVTRRDGTTIPYLFEMDSAGPFGQDLACRWLDKREALRRYRRLLPALVAAHAFDQLPRGAEIRHVAASLVDRPLPGWFDLHAAR
jgi:FkbM family methyltransferase